MANQYVEDRDGELYLIDSRVSLASIVQAFLDGQTAESIAQSFPTLRLEQVYGAIAHYLARREEIDRRLESERIDLDLLRRTAREKDPAFYQKLADFRRAASVGQK